MKQAAFKPEETLDRLQSMGLSPADCSLLMAVIMHYASNQFYLHLGLPPQRNSAANNLFPKYVTNRFPTLNNLHVVEIVEIAELERMYYQDMRAAEGEV